MDLELANYIGHITLNITLNMYKTALGHNVEEPCRKVFQSGFVIGSGILFLFIATLDF